MLKLLLRVLHIIILKFYNTLKVRFKKYYEQKRLHFIDEIINIE